TKNSKEITLASEHEEHAASIRRGKAWRTNLYALGGITAYGFAKWEYGQRKFHFKSEGYFEKDSSEGGTDKLGHFYTTYGLSHAFAWGYRSWGYSDSEANLYGTLSSLGFQTFMEFGDGFSSFGASPQDMVANFLGAGLGYTLNRYPSIASKIDFRMEYLPDFSESFDVLTDYQNQKYLLAVKADGFNFITNPLLKYLELQVGYYARGYEEYDARLPDTRRRYIFYGIGINVSKVLQRKYKTRVLDYIQLPYTAFRKRHEL
ncbi:MAG: YfiM family protein, partial [Pseudomonadales bacterium]|nr:YfiM family protein [Pseudomonadales bacterium]